LKQYPEIDPERTAALGGSYGGFMINWLNGHNPGFKAMVCHDGIFSTTDAFYTTEEVWFPIQYVLPCFRWTVMQT
jgi:dipeptidyl aminopeptidase/acylaminoacyl peptidase